MVIGMLGAVCPGDRVPCLERRRSAQGGLFTHISQTIITPDEPGYDRPWLAKGTQNSQGVELHAAAVRTAEAYPANNLDTFVRYRPILD
jgi:hypothetical protein